MVILQLLDVYSSLFLVLLPYTIALVLIALTFMTRERTTVSRGGHVADRWVATSEGFEFAPGGDVEWEEKAWVPFSSTSRLFIIASLIFLVIALALDLILYGSLSQAFVLLLAYLAVIAASQILRIRGMLFVFCLLAAVLAYYLEWPTLIPFLLAGFGIWILLKSRWRSLIAIEIVAVVIWLVFSRALVINTDELARAVGQPAGGDVSPASVETPAVAAPMVTKGVEAAPKANQPRLSIGTQVKNVHSGPVNLRRTPGYEDKSPDDVIKTVQPAARGLITGGPVKADDLTWWKVAFDGVEGWIAERNRQGIELLQPAQ